MTSIEQTPEGWGAKVPWYKRPWIRWTAAILASLFVGVAIGTTGNDANADDLEAERDDLAAQVEDLEGLEPETVTETVTEEVDVTPAACVEALDYADEGFNIAADYIGVSARAFTIAGDALANPLAVDDGTVAELEGILEDMTGYNADLEAISGPYNAAKADCRDAS